jgi:hypothetical protein
MMYCTCSHCRDAYDEGFTAGYEQATAEIEKVTENRQSSPIVPNGTELDDLTVGPQCEEAINVKLTRKVKLTRLTED